jgi:tripartite ATP-independent transporter DctM subunit
MDRATPVSAMNPTADPIVTLTPSAGGDGSAASAPWWMRPLEATAAALIASITVLLLVGVVSRYVFGRAIVWVDEVVSMQFIWAAMIGATIAVYRNEHLRLSVVVDRLPERLREFVHAFALVAMAAVLVALIGPAFTYAHEEWAILTPALNIPNAFRVAAIAFGIVAMLTLLVLYAGRSVRMTPLILATVLVAAIAGLCWMVSPQLSKLGSLNIAIFLVGFVAVCLAAGVPIAFCFAAGAVSYLAFTTQVPLMVVVGRMDEGISSLVLVSVPIFVLLGCVLDATGMGKAIVDFLASLLGHIKAGMSYVLLGSLFIVSGISGSKVSDMATVAPALFPEMKRRGHKGPDMVALLATGAAMADTVPPSIVLIVLGAVAGVSIAGLFQSGFVVAMVLLLSLLLLARWKARHEDMSGTKRASIRVVGRMLLLAGPALVLPFLIRSLVGEGVATATEVSTVAVIYALLIGHFMYGGLGLRKLYTMLVETAALSGAVLLVLGAASAMAWAITQSGVVQQLSQFLTTLPGGPMAFMAVTIVVFVLLGCLLEGLPAVLLLAPIMFPIAKKLGINDIQYSMVVVCAMNVGMMLPPVGVGFYIACKIGGARPDETMAAIWPYLLALLIGVVVIAAVPWISTVAL